MIKKTVRPNLFCLLIILIGICSSAYSQTIHYSRQMTKTPTYEKMQLVSNIAGHHHLLFFTPHKGLILCGFNRELQALEEKKLPINLTEGQDLRIIPFRNFYYLYLHKRGSTKHELWKINAAGDAVSLSRPFQDLIETTLKTNTSTLQLINRGEQLAIVANTYFNELKSLATTIVKVDDNFKPLATNHFSYPFELGPDQLNQVMLIGEHLFLLKTTRHTSNYTLELTRTDLATGKTLRKSFSSPENMTHQASFRYNSSDSSLLVQSIAGPFVFISKLNLSLAELVPGTLFAPPLSNNESANFVLLGGDVQQWLALNLPARRRSSSPRRNEAVSTRIQERNEQLPSRYELTYDERRQEYFIQLFRNTATGFGTYEPYSTQIRESKIEETALPVRFSVIDKEFKLVDDSVVVNQKSPVTVNGGQFANIRVENSSYLILKQDLPRRKKGLLLVSVNDRNQLTTSDIAVYDKYEYLLQNAQSIVNESLLIPYKHKSEVGLVKLSFAGIEK